MATRQAKSLKRARGEGSQESISNQGPNKHRNSTYLNGGGSDSGVLHQAPDEVKERSKSNRQDHPISHSINALQSATAMTTRSKNGHMRGRKRFVADFKDMQELSGQGYVVRGLRIKDFESGEDEGSVQFKVMNGDSVILASTLLVSDTSEYPENHIFFASSQDRSSNYTSMLEDVSSWNSCTIEETIDKLFNLVASRLTGVSSHDIQDEDEEMEDEDEEYHDYDDLDENFGLPNTDLDRQRLQRDFLEIVALDNVKYRPGIIRFDSSEFIITVSMPIAALDIPGRALMAWDPCLLSQAQHLTLIIAGAHGVYPPLNAEGHYRPPLRADALKFRVGLTKRYKPSKEHAQDAVRKFALIIPDEESEDQTDNNEDEDPEELAAGHSTSMTVPIDVDTEEEEEGKFDEFSLSESLDSLLNHTLMRLIPLRLKFGLGWAGAESLLVEAERSQRKPEELYVGMRNVTTAADQEEKKLTESYNLPSDPILYREDNSHINLPLVAFSYLVRRLTLCTRYCIVCHNKLKVDYEALKPFVCDSQLCTYQFYLHNRGPSLEYEIRTNPTSVDLLVSLTYIAAVDGALDHPLPTGLGLRVPRPAITNTSSPTPAGWVPPYPYHATTTTSTTAVTHHNVTVLSDAELVDFDELDIHQMRSCIREMVDTLPPIMEMKQHLEQKVKAGKSKPKLKDIDPLVLPAAWSILRWCVGSCTALLEEITSGEDMIKNIGEGWRQFRFSVGAPDAEAKFKTAVIAAQQQDRNAVAYPSLYGFHGSHARNWHSIIRHGLWYKTIVNGRAYGDGVYFAKEGNVSTGSYSQATSAIWRNSEICPITCTALAEIVNLPQQYRSTNPYLVVQHTEWIVCRYLLVKGRSNSDTITETEENPSIPRVRLDPRHPLTLNHKQITIPDPSYKIEKLLSQRKQEVIEEGYDEDDHALFVGSNVQKTLEADMILDDTGGGTQGTLRSKPADDWEHDPDWVSVCVAHLMPPPAEATPSATAAIQRELKAMLKEQENAPSLRELGWYMPPDLIGDNLFQWIVELHSLEKDLPIARDLAAKGINSLVFEIRFPPSFPHSPPFFRIIKPRFLPFIHGGGGHVTGGGSMCMDLLTADGWLPSYSISSVLLQIRLAISNLDPRPARLNQDWDRPYGVQEALESYKRAAATHGWQIPTGLERLVL